ALIATALGLLIALVALFAFNFFSRLKSRALDEMERLGSRLVDRIRLDQESGNSGLSLEDRRPRRAAAVP
ncbi:MAG TPA: MotA/TolQ/ExbB proton channel family protein, partial [Candidatus Margulisiibacteriota bacterium]|nr:MotA/TolQ/ExbB proton channel family protein [Candidatus Margulisiibacteriota bacterium]